MKRPVDPKLESIARELEQLIPTNQGVFAIDRIKDEEFIRGNDAGLLSIATAIVWCVAGDEESSNRAESHLTNMASGATFFGIWLVEDANELKRMRKQRMKMWPLVICLILILALTVLGLVTVVGWLF